MHVHLFSFSSAFFLLSFGLLPPPVFWSLSGFLTFFLKAQLVKPSSMGDLTPNVFRDYNRECQPVGPLRTAHKPYHCVGVSDELFFWHFCVLLDLFQQVVEKHLKHTMYVCGFGLCPGLHLFVYQFHTDTSETHTVFMYHPIEKHLTDKLISCMNFSKSYGEASKRTTYLCVLELILTMSRSASGHTNFVYRLR